MANYLTIERAAEIRLGPSAKLESDPPLRFISGQTVGRSEIPIGYALPHTDILLVEGAVAITPFSPNQRTVFATSLLIATGHLPDQLPMENMLVPEMDAGASWREFGHPVTFDQQLLNGVSSVFVYGPEPGNLLPYMDCSHFDEQY